MPRETVLLYPDLKDKAIKAHCSTRISRGHQGVWLNFDVIRPGYDSQGRKRNTWTQFVYNGIPIFEVKVYIELKATIDQFDAQWAKSIGDNMKLAEKALANCMRERTRRFRDGITGESPAPALSVDGREDGKSYPS